MADEKLILDADAIQRGLTRTAHEIAEANADNASVGLIGIQRGGVHLAKRLAGLLGGIWGRDAPVGVLDVSMHRDDISQRGIVSVQPTEVPFDVEGKTVVLVDDVLYSGRTVRAALDAMNDIGRPDVVRLAVLVDRGHRDLPIRADHVGKNLPSARTERVAVRLSELDDVEGVWIS